MNEELKPCRCGRMNWHERTHCSWCARPLRENPKVYRVMDRIMFVVAIAAIVALVLRLGVLR